MGRWIEAKLWDVCVLKTWNSKSKFLVEWWRYLVMDMWAVSEDWRNISYKKTNVSKDIIKSWELVMPKDDIWWWFIIGKVSCILEDDKYVLSDHVYKLTNLKIDWVYLQYLVNSYFVNSWIKQCMTWSAQLWISKWSVERQDLYYPESLDEQRRIAEILSTIDEAIDSTQALIDKHEQIKEGMMHDLFTRWVDPATGSLRPHPSDAPELYKDSELGLIPKEWEVVQINDVLKNIIDYRGKTPTKTKDWIPLITAKNVRMWYVDYSEMEYIANAGYSKWMTRWIPNKWDVLFTTEAPCWFVASLDRDDKVAFAQRVIILQTNESYNPYYLKYRLISKFFQNYLDSKVTGSNVKWIQSKKFILFNIAVSKSSKEQELLYQCLDKKNLLINSLQKQKQKLLLQKQWLMDDLLSGEVRVM